MKKIKFFSQNGQDRFLNNHIFKKNSNGIFIDIGANDGITFSNTYFFEKKGWSGICIEPIPEVFEKLKKNRKCNCICGVMSEKNIEFSEFLHVTGASEMLSGILDKYDNDHLERIEKDIKNNNEKKEIIKVQNFNFNKIIKFTHIDYLTIDTEGSEFDILKTINFSNFEIKVISIENDYKNNNINDFLKNNNFKYLTTIGSDEIYLNKNFLNLIKNRLTTNLLIYYLKILKKIKLNIKKVIIKKCLTHFFQ